MSHVEFVPQMVAFQQEIHNREHQQTSNRPKNIKNRRITNKLPFRHVAP
jgi:hypothetical protein